MCLCWGFFIIITSINIIVSFIWVVPFVCSAYVHVSLYTQPHMHSAAVGIVKRNCWPLHLDIIKIGTEVFRMWQTQGKAISVSSYSLGSRRP